MSFRARLDPPGERHRGRGLVAVLAWAGGIAAIATVGLVGSRPSDDRTERLTVASAAASATPASTAARSLFVDHPGQTGELITTHDVVIRGRVALGVSVVRIWLETRNGKPVAAQTIEAGNPLRSGLMPFEGRFRLSLARPFGRIVALVIAVGDDGVPVDAVRRRFELGEIREEPRTAGY